MFAGDPLGTGSAEDLDEVGGPKQIGVLEDAGEEQLGIMNSLGSGGRSVSDGVLPESGSARTEEKSLPPNDLHRLQGNHLRILINDWAVGETADTDVAPMWF